MNNIATDKVIKTPKAKAASWFFTALIMTLTALSFLSFFSDVNTTIEYNAAWKGAYAAVLIMLFVTMTISLLSNKSKTNIKGGIFKKTLTVIAGLFGFGVLTAFSIFSGIPTTMHYLTSKNGQIEVTVIEKNDNYNKRKCSPRLIIEEFTFFNSNHICPGEDAFKKIDEGSKIKLIGNVSPYGIEPTEVQWLTSE